MFPPHVVLAAVDFSDSSRVALECAARLATHCGAALHVLHAEDPLLAAAARTAGLELARETKDELAGFVRDVVPAGGRAPIRHVVAGRAVDVICDIAQRERADVVVVGMHGMSGIERAAFGSTTENVLRRADVSVLAVPQGWRPPREAATDLSGTGPVVVGIRATAPALAAARAASRLARLLGTNVEAVHAIPPIGALPRWSAHAEAAQRERIGTATKEIEAALHGMRADGAIALRVETGHVADRLAAAATPSDDRQPLLVLGRRTRRERDGAPGSTAYRILTMTAVPVLMYLDTED